METTGVGASILRFGAFELDLRTNELRRAGLLIKLAPQHSRVLRYLLERAGEICTRDEIQREIWGSETFVDFDRSLNVSIAQIRSILNDDSESPRFIQTVPRRGYRFVAPVEVVCTSVAVSPVVERPRRRNWAIAASVLILCAALGTYLALRRTSNPRTMLAVLPFENLTNQAGDVPIIDGLADELITQFGSVEPALLGVIGRTSVMRYAATKPGVTQVARDLGVQYIIEGGVRHDGDRIRVSTRLIRASDQSQVWSETFEQEASNRLEIEEQVAARATVAVAQELFNRTARPDIPGHKPSPAAYDAYMKGRYLLHKSNRKDTERAIAAFEEASRLDNSFAEPLAAMSETYVGLALSGMQPPSAALAGARKAAERSLQIDEKQAEAHNALAEVYFWNDWNWDEARKHFERALAINPSQAQTHHDYAIYQVETGHAEKGIAELRRAITIDPLSPRVNVDAGWVLLQAHHFEEAIKAAQRALELEPTLTEARACIERAKQYQGKTDDQTQKFFEERLANPQTTAYNRALANAALNRPEEAMNALEEAYQHHDILMPLMNTEPTFKTLHGNPKFQELVARLKLTT